MNTSKMSRLTLLAASAAVSAFASAQTVNISAADFGSNPGNLTNAGAPSGGTNTIVTATVTSGYVLTNFVDVLSGDFTQATIGSWSNEPSIRLESDAFPGLYAYFRFNDTGASYTSFSITGLTSRPLLAASSTWIHGSAATLSSGAAIPSGSIWTMECYESYDDSTTGLDSTGANISFTLPGNPPPPPTPPSAIDLGVLSASNSTLTVTVSALNAAEVKWYKFTLPTTVDAATPDFFEAWTSNSGAGSNDTELGLYTSTGVLIADDDDSGDGAFSDISFGAGTFPSLGTGIDGTNLAAGTYYLSASKFNSAFNAGFGVVSTATASTDFNLNLATSVTAAPPVDLTGTLNLADTVFGGAYTRAISYSVMQGTTSIASGTVTADASSESFTISVPASASGAATIEWDGSSFLTRKTSINLTGSAVAVGSVSVQNGDVDNSGEVDAVDIDEVIADFGDTSDNTSDVDVSGEVDAADIDIVIANFGGVND